MVLDEALARGGCARLRSRRPGVLAADSSLAMVRRREPRAPLRRAVPDGTVLPMAAPEDPAHGNDASELDEPQKPHRRWTAAPGDRRPGLLPTRCGPAGTRPSRLAEPPHPTGRRHPQRPRPNPAAAALLAAEDALDRGLTERRRSAWRSCGDRAWPPISPSGSSCGSLPTGPPCAPWTASSPSRASSTPSSPGSARGGHPPPLLVPPAPAAYRRANVFTVRTSFDRGVTLELVEPGGLISGPEVVFGPWSSALPTSPEARRVRGPRRPREGSCDPLHAQPVPARPDPRPSAGLAGPSATPASWCVPPPPPWTWARLSEAAALLTRLETDAPDHADAAFLRQRLEDREVALRRNLRTVRFVLLEVACDPKPGGSSCPETARSRTSRAGHRRRGGGGVTGGGATAPSW